MQVPFGEWLPDQPEHGKQGANVANNVYRAANTYKRFPSLVSYSSNTMNQDSRGAGSFRDNTNTVFNFTANNKTIFKLENINKKYNRRISLTLSIIYSDSLWCEYLFAGRGFQYYFL